MPAPQSLALQLTLVVGLALLSGPRQELKVLRAAPSADAAPTAPVTVTFDRPVAGSLDRAGRARCSPSLDGSGIATEVAVAVE